MSTHIFDQYDTQCKQPRKTAHNINIKNMPPNLLFSEMYITSWYQNTQHFSNQVKGERNENRRKLFIYTVAILY
jgi:hypothetical protein